MSVMTGRRTLAGAGVLAMLLAMLSAPADAPARTDSPDPVNNPTIDYTGPERSRAEPALPDPMPAIPATDALHGFLVSATTRNDFGIDPASVTIIGNKVIQFTLVVTSPRGVRNISYDAIDCETGKFRFLAFGRDGAGWTPVRSEEWHSVLRGDTVNAQYRELARNWCEGSGAAGKVPELMRRLSSLPSRYLN